VNRVPVQAPRCRRWHRLLAGAAGAALAAGALAMPPTGDPVSGEAGIVAGLADGRLQLRTVQVVEGGALTMVLKGASSEPVIWAPASCAAAYRQVRARMRPVTLGAAPFTVQLNWGWLAHGGRPLVDFEADWCDAARRDPPATVSRELRLLSLVGPVLSVAVSASEAMAGGPPYHHTAWRTMDVRTGAAVDIRQVVDADSLVAALRQDRVVQRRLGEPTAGISLDRLLNALQPDGQPLAFAVYQADAATGRVALRIAASPDPGCGLCTNEPTQIGIWVRPLRVHADAMRQGLLMHDAARRPRP